MLNPQFTWNYMENFGTAWNRLERFGISWKWIFDTIFDTAP
jgi:hypothetical protein